jgi:hypothetical protein
MLLWQNEAAPTGPYYTWIGINDGPNERQAKQLDAVLNANVLLSAGLLKLSLPGTVSYLKEIVERETYEANIVYCLSPHFLIYAISRAYADGQVTDLAPLVPILQNYILNKLPSPQAEPSALNQACLAVSLLNLQADMTKIEPYLSALLNSQQPDGCWPNWAAWASYAPNYDGGATLTTALALEALGKWSQRGVESRRF